MGPDVRPWLFGFGLVLVMSIGCGETTEPPGWEFSVSTERPNAAEKEFAGYWLIQDMPHATDLATLYRFYEDGSLEEIKTVALGRPKREKGHVRRCSAPPGANDVCPFGDTWRINREGQLLIDSDCPDASPAGDIVLSYTYLDKSGSAADVGVVSVGDDDGWCIPGFGWRWRRCESEECL